MSASFDIDLSGLQRRLAHVKRSVPKVAAKVMQDAGRELTSEIRKQAPRRSGRLRSSVVFRGVRRVGQVYEAVVVVKAVYARAVEKRRGYINPTVARLARKIPARLARLLRRGTLT